MLQPIYEFSSLFQSVDLVATPFFALSFLCATKSVMLYLKSCFIAFPSASVAVSHVWMRGVSFVLNVFLRFWDSNDVYILRQLY